MHHQIYDVKEVLELENNLTVKKKMGSVLVFVQESSS
jgi:hypothetical protein